MAKVEIVGAKELLQNVLALLRDMGIFHVEPATIGFVEEELTEHVRSFALDEQTGRERAFLEEITAKIDDLFTCLPAVHGRTTYVDPPSIVATIARTIDRHAASMKEICERRDALRKERKELERQSVFLGTLSSLLQTAGEAPDLDFIGLTIREAGMVGALRALLAGKRVELLDEDTAWELLGRRLRQSRNLSFVKLTPGHLEVLAKQVSSEEIARGCSRTFIVGGETLTAHHIRFWREAAPDTNIVNEYGPTETAVGCCAYRVSDGKHESESIPIGRPIANTQVYILDPRFEPVPIGIVGELCIGGEGLARGYLNRPELTAEKFVPNPFGAPSSRLYRSGDLGRYLPDGNIEFIGRVASRISACPDALPGIPGSR